MVSSLVLIRVHPQTRESSAVLASHRDRVRAQLRNGFVWKIKDLRGVTGEAYMSYTEKGFARGVVVRYNLVLVGWPADIPFVNLSDIPGGVRPLLRLRTLWNAGTLRFEPATAEDVANAARDPRSVHPNPALLDQTPVRRRPATVVAPIVLHPGTLSLMGEHPTSTRPSVATLGYRPRAQRSDTKKSRFRPVTNPENKPLRRPKRGVKSSRYVLETGGGAGGRASWDGGYRTWAVNDPIEEFRSAALTRMRRAALGGGKVVGEAEF